MDDSSHTTEHIRIYLNETFDILYFAIVTNNIYIFSEFIILLHKKLHKSDVTILINSISFACLLRRIPNMYTEVKDKRILWHKL